MYKPTSAFKLCTKAVLLSAIILFMSVAFFSRAGNIAANNAAPDSNAASRFRYTGSLNIARDYHTATLLPSGIVLVAGGLASHRLTASTEVYDPTSQTWSVTGSLNASRESHTATLLSNGKVLVAGGLTGVNFHYTASAELYD
jgi:hypothetical protein